MLDAKFEIFHIEHRKSFTKDNDFVEVEKLRRAPTFGAFHRNMLNSKSIKLSDPFSTNQEFMLNKKLA